MKHKCNQSFFERTYKAFSNAWKSQAGWCTLVNPATQEVDIEGQTRFKARPGRKLVIPYFKIKLAAVVHAYNPRYSRNRGRSTTVQCWPPGPGERAKTLLKRKIVKSKKTQFMTYACLASMRLWIQSQVPVKKKKERKERCVLNQTFWKMIWL
jgi:hypothetical protein